MHILRRRVDQQKVETHLVHRAFSECGFLCSVCCVILAVCDEPVCMYVYVYMYVCMCSVCCVVLAVCDEPVCMYVYVYMYVYVLFAVLYSQYVMSL